jgi:hypothetical protein
MEPAAPTPPLTTSCTNCSASMGAADKWCATCGQKAYQGPPSFWHMLGEFFETVFSLDNRLFRTLAYLVIPGRLTNFFLAGKQKPYFHPLRLFFVSGVLMVAAYSLYTSQRVGDTLDKTMEERRAKAYAHRFGGDLREGMDSIKTSFPETTVVAATDSLLHLLGYLTVAKSDSFFMDFMAYEGGLSFRSKQILLLNDDYQLLPPSELVEIYNVEGIFQQYIFKQNIRINRLNLTGLTTIMSQLIWGFLLLVPMAALLLKLLYIRRKRRYVEHFIFTLHIHSFLFLTQFLGALGLLIFDAPWLVVLSGVATAIYFLLALKRVYGQGWWKTLIKAVLLSWGYFVLAVFALSMAAVLAVLAF